VKRELHQSIVEVGTTICGNMDELEAAGVPHSAASSRRRPSRRARDRRGGDPPVLALDHQVLSPGERYEHIVEELQMLARSLLIFACTCTSACPTARARSTS